MNAERGSAERNLLCVVPNSVEMLGSAYEGDEAARLDMKRREPMRMVVRSLRLCGQVRARERVESGLRMGDGSQGSSMEEVVDDSSMEEGLDDSSMEEDSNDLSIQDLDDPSIEEGLEDSYMEEGCELTGSILGFCEG